MGAALLQKVLQSDPAAAAHFKKATSPFPADMLGLINAAFCRNSTPGYPADLKLSSTKAVFDDYFERDGDDYRLGLIMPIVLGWTDLQWHKVWKRKLKQAFGRNRLRAFENAVIEALSQNPPWEIQVVKDPSPTAPVTIKLDDSAKKVTIQAGWV